MLKIRLFIVLFQNKLKKNIQFSFLPFLIFTARCPPFSSPPNEKHLEGQLARACSLQWLNKSAPSNSCKLVWQLRADVSSWPSADRRPLQTPQTATNEVNLLRTNIAVTPWQAWLLFNSATFALLISMYSLFPSKFTRMYI